MKRVKLHFEGQFEFRPLEPGYGLTIGNALRRVLLSSLEGYAITGIKIEPKNSNNKMVMTKVINKLMTSGSENVRSNQ